MATSPSEPPPFRRLLIADRGDVAVRVLRTCRDLGIETVALQGDADHGALHVRLADRTHPLAPDAMADGVLRIDHLLEVARTSGAEAVHPGSGVLCARAGVARACAAAGLVFIGPSANAIAAMADATEARRRVARAGVPVRPDAASDHGDTAIARPRQVEVQVLADACGDVVHLFERECSIRHRHATLIAESPSLAVDAPTRARLGDAALAVTRALAWVGAGTVEFLVDPQRGFWFVAMRPGTHAVTEAVTGIDLVRAEIVIAAGRRLPVRQHEIAPRGWAIACRVAAEDPASDFQPTRGRLAVLRAPAGIGIRDDAGVGEGGEVAAVHDPLLSTLTAWAPTRPEALARLQRALAEYTVLGPTTTLAFHRWALAHPAVVRGDLDTGFLAREYTPGVLAEADDDPDLPLIAAAIAAAERSRPVTTAVAPASRWASVGRAEGLRG